MKNDYDWKTLSSEIDEINKIVSKCEDSTKEKCFELLFNMRFGKTQVYELEKAPESQSAQPEQPIQSANKAYKLPGNVLVMLRKNGLSEQDLEKLFMLEHEPILPIYKIDHSKMATAQLQKVFMILLENALTSGQFKADYTEIRDTCKEEGLFDGNFATNLKAKSDYFKGAISKSSIDNTGFVELSGTGTIKLAEMIKQMIQ